MFLPALVTALALPSMNTIETPDVPAVLPLRERAEVRERWLGERLELVLPEVMRRAGVDLWIVVSREYAEDPVFESLAPATWFSARRRTVLLFHDRGEEHGVDALSVARYPVSELYENLWDPAEQPDQWARIAEVIAERDPRAIGVNTSAMFALADGMTASQLNALFQALPPELRERVVPAENVAIGWLETRSTSELEVYPSIVKLARSIIHEGLSDRAIVPGVTTTDDLEWWYRERVAALDLDTWFHPLVSFQRAGDGHSGSFAVEEGEGVIRPGDFLHVDLGLSYLGLHTDTQQHAYVLRPGESAPPAGLVAGFASGNRLQDLLTSEFRTGRTGNDILAAARERALAEGLRPSIYTHPLGLHGHAAGPTIGLWDRQDGVPGRGDYPLHPNTAHSVELNVTAPVDDWGGIDVRFMLEEDAWFDGEQVHYLDGRQREILLVGGASED